MSKSVWHKLPPIETDGLQDFYMFRGQDIYIRRGYANSTVPDMRPGTLGLYLNNESLLHLARQLPEVKVLVEALRLAEKNLAAFYDWAAKVLDKYDSVGRRPTNQVETLIKEALRPFEEATDG